LAHVDWARFRGDMSRAELSRCARGRPEEITTKFRAVSIIVTLSIFLGPLVADAQPAGKVLHIRSFSTI
jgi:hypothetical protein